MATNSDPLDLYGEEKIPSHGVLVIANRLAFADLLHLEKLFGSRKLVYLVERGLNHDPLTRAHLEKDGVVTMPFSADETSADEFKRELHQHLSEEAAVVFVPALARTRSGQVVQVPSKTLRFLTGFGAPVLPLYVDHPEETRLDIESRDELERTVFSFGDPLLREAANPANLLESLFVAGERAFSDRPILRSHLAYEILRGLKKHGRSAEIIDGFDGGRLRFDKLLAASIALSRIIRKETQRKRVGVILPPGKGGMVANVAVLLAGKVPVNLNFTAGEKAVESSIRQAGLDKFITADPFVRKLTSFAWPPARDLILLDRILPKAKKNIVLWLLVSKLCGVGLLSRILKIPRQGGHEEAVLLFTSGSSGEPKGVVLSHRNLLANINQFGCRIDLKSTDRVLACLPLFHSFGCTVTTWYPLLEGLSVVTYPTPLETAKLAELIEKHRVSLLLATPTFLRGYLRRATKEQLETVKMVITGAEKLPKKLADSFEGRFGKKVLEGYGLTETSPVSNVNLPDPDPLPGKEGESQAIIPNQRFRSVGLLIPGMAARLTHPDTHEPLPLTSSGMIWLKGANIFERYLDQPEKTAAVIRNGWFMTGDLGRFDEDGFLYIEGRLSRFSKIGGEMVPHETVEELVNKVLGLKDDERRIAVVGVPDDAKGEALVLLSADPDIDLQDLRTRLVEEGIPALWIPKKIIDVPEVPMLASGKLDLKGCENIAREGEGSSGA